jgi:hypothetical protein
MRRTKIIEPIFKYNKYKTASANTLTREINVPHLILQFNTCFYKCKRKKFIEIYTCIYYNIGKSDYLNN